MHDLIVIGGGGAGLTAALTAKKTNHEANITLITDERLSYSPCALPFVISGEIKDVKDISGSMMDICRNSGINCVLDKVVSINTQKKTVKTKKKKRFTYTSLIIATGGIPGKPPVKGVNLGNIYTLRKIKDAEDIRKKAKRSRSAVVVGAGAVGLEMSAAFRKLGLKTTLIEGMDLVLDRSLDIEFSRIIEDKLKDEGVKVLIGNQVEEMLGDKKVEAVRVAGRVIPADLVVLGTGVKPDIELAEKAGISVDGGIMTDGYMQTNVKEVYAAGDCVDSRSLITGKLMLSQLGTTAIRHGMTAGMNSVGGYATFEGVLNSIILKIFELEVGRTGLTEKDAVNEGIETVTGRVKSTSKSAYYPGAKEVDVKLIFNRLDRRIIGAQVIGGGDAAGKIDLIAFAIGRNACIEDLMKLKYCYTPPLTPSHHAIVLAAENAFRKLIRIKEERKKRF